MSNEKHADTKTPREYGELFYHYSAVATVLRLVADTLEGDKRDVLLHLSYVLPSTMPWNDHSRDVQQQAGEPCLCRPVQFRMEHGSVFGDSALRLVALLRNGPSNEYFSDGKYTAGVVDQELHGVGS